MSDTIKRAGISGILVLAMVGNSVGNGAEFRPPVGIVCGLLGLVCAIEMDMTNGLAFGLLCLSIPLASLVGYGYGKHERRQGV
ncbi:hypothetical protein MASR2M17_18750 [Aminivibrio sp.]